MPADARRWLTRKVVDLGPPRMAESRLFAKFFQEMRIVTFDGARHAEVWNAVFVEFFRKKHPAVGANHETDASLVVHDLLGYQKVELLVAPTCEVHFHLHGVHWT